MARLAGRRLLFAAPVLLVVTFGVFAIAAASPFDPVKAYAGTAALGGKLYVFGGRTRNADGTVVTATLNTVEMYDPGVGSWSARTSMPTGRRTMAVGTLNGRAQVMGGEATAEGGTFPQNEEYDPATDTWRQLRQMMTPRHGTAAFASICLLQ